MNKFAIIATLLVAASGYAASIPYGEELREANLTLSSMRDGVSWLRMKMPCRKGEWSKVPAHRKRSRRLRNAVGRVCIQHENKLTGFAGNGNLVIFL